MFDKVKRLWMEGRKAVIGGAVAFAGWGYVAFADGTVTTAEWFGLVVPLLTGLGVYHAKNSTAAAIPPTMPPAAAVPPTS